MKLILLVLILAASYPLNGQTARLEDNSDWWSYVGENFGAPQIKAKNRAIGSKSLLIAGIKLGSPFKQITAKMGPATQVERGEAATSRDQLCYTSADNPGRVHLIFEFGEVESVFYLFTGGADWKGSELCAKSKQVSMNAKTASGLRLGLTKSQVESILGKADWDQGNRLVYSREVRRKTTAKELQHFRNPESLSDQELHETFDFYTVDVYIEARFFDSKLIYLAVSNTEIY